MKRNNYYYLLPDGDGNLLIQYVTPCDDTMTVAYVPAANRGEVNPPVFWLKPAIGVNGLVKIAALLSEFAV